MLTRLKLHQFRYIKPGTELVFTEHFNVLLGKNGTGKTTLLDLLSVVLRSDFSALRDEEFDIECEYAHEHGTGLVRFANRFKRPPQRPASTPGGVGKARQHQPHVAVTLHLDSLGVGQGYEIEVDGATMRWRSNDGAWKGNDIVDVFDGLLLDILRTTLLPDPYGDDPQGTAAFGLLQEFWCDALETYRFDESLEVFASITSGDVGWTPRPNRAPAISMGIASKGFAHHTIFVPFEYRPALPEPGQTSTKVELPPHSCLAKFPKLAGIKNMSMSFAVKGSRQESDGLWWSLGRAEFMFSVSAGVFFGHDVLSYGQKRLLAFLYYLDANPKFVIADELVNGMHHDWIRACLAEIGDRQAFLTSQNPLLLDYLPLESVEQVQRSFIQCRADVVDDATVISWSNLAAEDAAELFADYQVGIQHVGEILRARGLW